MNSRYSLPFKTPSREWTTEAKTSTYHSSLNENSKLHTSKPEFKSPESTVYNNDELTEFGTAPELSKLNGNYRKPSSPVSKLAEMDSSTILRQRRELQLMITELKDRDKELNVMVQSHHKQLVSWEVDRERISMLEKQLCKLKAEYRKKHEQCKAFKNQMKLYENEIQSKTKELNSVKAQLNHIAEKADVSSNHIEELDFKNNTLQSSIEELSSNVGSLRAHEEQLETLLRLKDNDLKDANHRIEELTAKLKMYNVTLINYKKLETDVKIELEKYQNENACLKEEIEKVKCSFHQCEEMSGENEENILKLKQDIILLQKELLIVVEREKRKDCLLELHRSKQERNEAEMNHLNLLYDSVKQELTLTKQKLSNQDDKISLFDMSEFGGEDTTSSKFFNSTLMLESPNFSFLNSSPELGESLHFSPVTGNASIANLSMITGPNEDGVKMTTKELINSDGLSVSKANEMSNSYVLCTRERQCDDIPVNEVSDRSSHSSMHKPVAMLEHLLISKEDKHLSNSLICDLSIQCSSLSAIEENNQSDDSSIHISSNQSINLLASEQSAHSRNSPIVDRNIKSVTLSNNGSNWVAADQSDNSLHGEQSAQLMASSISEINVQSKVQSINSVECNVNNLCSSSLFREQNTKSPSVLVQNGDNFINFPPNSNSINSSICNTDEQCENSGFELNNQH